jgi:hypothetical protein
LNSFGCSHWPFGILHPSAAVPTSTPAQGILACDRAYVIGARVDIGLEAAHRSGDFVDPIFIVPFGAAPPITRMPVRRARRNREETAILVNRRPEDLADVDAFLAAPKEIHGRIIWKPKAVRSDYTHAAYVVIVIDGRLEGGSLQMTAQVFQDPPKYSFALIWRGARIFGLDVSDNVSHFNPSTKTLIRGTHWQRWPSMEAEADSRSLDHRGWFDAFLERAHIRPARMRYVGPPFKSVQLELPI